MAEMSQVLTKLAERTSQNRVLWREGEVSDTFSAVLGKMSLQLMGPRKGADGIILLRIQGRREGRREETIGSAIYDPEEPNVNSELVSILEEARRIASDDPRLDEVLEALDAAPPVP